MTLKLEVGKTYLNHVGSLHLIKSKEIRKENTVYKSDSEEFLENGINLFDYNFMSRDYRYDLKEEVPRNPLKLEVGKTYLNRIGDHRTITFDHGPEYTHRYEDNRGTSFTETGHLISSCFGKFDLVKEVEESGLYTYSETQEIPNPDYKETSKEDEEKQLENITTILLNNNKPRISLVPPSAIIHLANAFGEGLKYGSYSWRNKENKITSTELLDKILRHVLSIIDGEDIDPESSTGKHHIDGVIADAAIFIDTLENGTLIDDRPPKGKAGELIRKHLKR